jgi:hypothetical protein
MTFFGYPRGHRVKSETLVFPQTPWPDFSGGYSPSNQASQEPDGHRQDDLQGWNGLSVRGAQAACFKYWASKRTPFFQRIRVMAAIFRAQVRRAIAGRIPLASKTW